MSGFSFDSNSSLIAPVRIGADAIGLILSAASHPQGTFIGIDANPDHIARGQAVVDALGLSNVVLHCLSFADAAKLANGAAEYVTAHGVLAWISRENRAALCDLASKWLRPGGALYLSYNAYPGWRKIAPFQALVNAGALEKSGNSTQRFNAAFVELQAAEIISIDVMEWIENQRGQLGETYFAHEYLNAHWEPCWSGDVISAMAERELAYVGQASNDRLREDFCFVPELRENIAIFQSAPAR